MKKFRSLFYKTLFTACPVQQKHLIALKQKHSELFEIDFCTEIFESY